MQSISLLMVAAAAAFGMFQWGRAACAAVYRFIVLFRHVDLPTYSFVGRPTWPKPACIMLFDISRTRACAGSLVWDREP